MARISHFLFALAGSATLFAAAPAIAQPGFYSLTTAAPVAEAKPVVRGMMFNCNGASCGAGEGTSRPAIVCASAARELGRITAFSAGGKAFGDEELAKCNAKAKTDTTQIVQR